MEIDSSPKIISPAMGEMNPQCTELLVLFGDGLSFDLVPPVRIRFAQYLDDPQRSVPLVKDTELTRIAKNVRFAFGNPPSEGELPRMTSLAALLSSVNPASMDKVLETPPWSKESENPLYSLAMSSYSLWSRFIPALKVLDKNILAIMFYHKKSLPSCTSIPQHDGIFTYQPTIDKDSSGNVIGISAGTKNFYKFGFLAVESGFWKLFWSNVTKKKPQYDRKLDWSLSSRYVDNDDFGSIQFKLTYVLSRKEHESPCLDHVKVGMIWEDEDEGWRLNVWSAIICLFSQVPKKAHTGDRWISEGPSSYSYDLIHPL